MYAMLLLFLAGALTLSGAPCCSIEVHVANASSQPLAGALVRTGAIESRTDLQGDAILRVDAPGPHTVEASHPGFQTLRQTVEATPERAVHVELLLPAARIESVTVEGASPDAPESATLAPLSAEQIKALPLDPPTVKDALPLVPGVVRTPEGRLSISGSPEYRSTLMVNALDTTDPATGQFGATVPIDSVASLNVFRSPFLAEYGRFTAAVVVVDTKRGGEKWHAELNDPTPELRLRSGHIRGVRGFTPRLSFSGPLVRHRLYLFQSAEYRLNKLPVFSLPFPENETWRESWNSHTQLDYVGASQVLTATVHLVPQKVKFEGLDFYNPRPATPDFRGREFHAGLTDRLTLGKAVLESAVAASEFLGRTWPQGTGELQLTPVENLGNYFFQQQRRARGYQWRESYSFTRGAHSLRIGGEAIHSTLTGVMQASPFSIAAGGRTISRVTFLNAPPFAVSDWESGFYAQDHWQVKPAFAVDYGLRADWQRLTGTLGLAPRLALSWAPFGDNNTVLRTGFGWFYDRVPLVAGAFPAYPTRIVDGTLLENQTGSRDAAGPLVFGPDRPGNFAPRSRTGSAQIEHRFGETVRLRANYMESHSRGLLVVAPAVDAMTLAGNGRSVYRQFEVVSRIVPRKGQELFASYTRSSGRANINDLVQYLGNTPPAVIRPDVYATADLDTPHRILVWGVIPLNDRTRIAPLFEYRMGRPYSALDAAQQYAGPPHGRRFPPFLSLDYRIARDIHVRKHAVQISFSMFNATNHWNPDTVRLNIADPQFAEFLGQHKRRFRLDFDFLF